MRENKIDAFISYRRDDNSLARLIQQLLEKFGLQVFIDKDDIGQGDWEKKLEEGIYNAANFIILLSMKSLEKINEPNDVVRWEIETAIKSNNRIILVVADKSVPIKSPPFPESIREIFKYNAIFYSHNHFNDFENELKCHLLFPEKLSHYEEANKNLKEMENVIKSEQYLKWVIKFLSKRYEELSNDLEEFPFLNGREYPIFCFKAMHGEKKFLHTDLNQEEIEFRSPELLPDLNSLGAENNFEIPQWVFKGQEGELRLDYFKMLSYGKRVKRWNMGGFALSRLELNHENKVEGFQARFCTYGEYCLTSQFLGYQLYKKYLSEEDGGTVSSFPNQIPIQFIKEKHSASLIHPTVSYPFFPLISVQAIVIYRDENEGGNWKTIVAKRADNVAVLPGFFQFLPAGGFEIYGREDDDHFQIQSQFDLRLALIREFLEEIFGDIDMTCEDPDLSAQDHSGSHGYRAIMNSIKNGGTSIHFLGVVTELVYLRSEFSFLIVIDDQSMYDLNYEINDPAGKRKNAKWLAGSNESKRLMKVDLQKLSALFSSDTAWNPSSVGLFLLLKDLIESPSSWLHQKYKNLPSSFESTI